MGQNSYGLLITDLKQEVILQKLEPLVEKELKTSSKLFEDVDLLVCNSKEFIKID